MARFVPFQHKRFRTNLKSSPVELLITARPKLVASLINHDRLTILIQDGDLRASLSFSPEEIEQLKYELIKLAMED